SKDGNLAPGSCRTDTGVNWPAATPLSPDSMLLTMPDLGALETILRESYPEIWVRHHLGSFGPAYFAAFDAADITRHLEQIRALDDEHLVSVRAWPADADGAASSETLAGCWWVEVVGQDAFQFLSTVCSLLAVSGFSIVEGRVFTSQPPPRGPVAATPG